jgi:hypothetical protein
VVHNVISLILLSSLHPKQHSASWRRRSSTYHSELVERPGLLDVLQRLREVLQLEVDLLLGSLGILDGLDLEGLDGLELAREVVGRGLELLEALLNLVDNGLVLQDAAVVGEVDGGSLLGQQLDLAAGVLVALLESLEGGDRLTTQAEGGGHFGPVELEGGASLFGREEGKLAHACNPAHGFVGRYRRLNWRGGRRSDCHAEHCSTSIDKGELTAAILVMECEVWSGEIEAIHIRRCLLALPKCRRFASSSTSFRRLWLPEAFHSHSFLEKPTRPGLHQMRILSKQIWIW